MKIKSVEIRGELIFNANAERFFKFPINNPIRFSLWEKGARYSTPSEISCDMPMSIESRMEVNVLFPETYLKREVAIGDEFYLETFPIIAGVVKVKKIIDC